MPMRDRLARLVQRNPERPSLRQRAAALKASAAKVMRRPAPAAAPPANAEAAPVVLPGTDAEFLRLEREWVEAREREEAGYARQREIVCASPDHGPAPQGMPEWREWYEKGREWRASSGLEEAEEDAKHWCGVVDDIAQQIAALPATSLTGMRVKARVLRYFEEIEVDPVRGLVGGLARDVLALAPEALPEDARALALVDALEREWGEWSSAGARDYWAEDLEVEARNDARADRRTALLDAALALPAGSRSERHAKALAHSWIGFVDNWRVRRTRDRYQFDGLLAFDIDAALAPDGFAGNPDCSAEAAGDASDTAPPQTAVGLDAALIALGPRFDAAAAEERAACERVNAAAAEATRATDLLGRLEDAADAAGDASTKLAHEIAALPAHTAEGLLLKIRALIHFDPFPFRGDLPDMPDPHQVLRHSLRDDALRGCAPPALAGRSA